jgi:fumarate hydratase class I
MEKITQKKISKVAFNLLANTATNYPKHFLEKLFEALRGEESRGSKGVIATIIQNILFAAEEPSCLCQDTGVPTFHIHLNPSIFIKGDITAAITEATIRATDEVPIRKNVIEPFSFTNLGNNTGWGTPFIYFHYSNDKGPMRMRAELKGFGGEIKSTADWIFTSTEDMEDAVLAYVLNNIILSKGEGCIPGFLGVGLGGYMSEAMVNAKNAVFRELTQKASGNFSHNDSLIHRLEARILRCVNDLGLGPMGDGGKMTALGVYLERRGTHTAVAPVAVSQQCWASRGSEALIAEDRVQYITPHLRKEEVPEIRQKLSQEFSKSDSKGATYELTTPIPMKDILKLRVRDIVYLSGTICTSRDGAHRRMVEKVKKAKEHEIPQEIVKNGIIFHCGPVITKDSERWCINAAGPTTSSRFTNDAAFLVDRGIIKVAIGKGTMGGNMVNTLKGKGVYLEAVGGCAVMYKNMIHQARVHWLDLGYPEAVWVFDVQKFGPLMVGIDSQGNSLVEGIMDEVYENARDVYRNEGLDPHKRYTQYPQTFAGLSLEEVIEKAKLS